MVKINAEHLLPDIRPFLDLSTEDRILSIEKDNWIGYPRAKLALTKLENLFNHPQRQRMPNLLIIGPTNNGKSMIVEKFCREYPPSTQIIQQPYDYKSKTVEVRERLIELPVLSVQMPPVPDVQRFCRAIIDKVVSVKGNEALLFKTWPQEDSIVKILRMFHVKMLIIDEIHNLLAG